MAIDTLGSYGKDGIDPIMEIIGWKDSDSNVKQHGLQAIKYTRMFLRD